MSYVNKYTHQKHWFLGFFSSGCFGVKFKSLIGFVLEIVPLFVKALLVLPIPPFVLNKGVIDGPLLI